MRNPKNVEIWQLRPSIRLLIEKKKLHHFYLLVDAQMISNLKFTGYHHGLAHMLKFIIT